MSGYKSFEFNRDNYAAPTYNPDDFDDGAASPPRQAWAEPSQTQGSSGAKNQVSNKRAQERGRRSPIQERELARRGDRDDAGPVTLSNLPAEDRER